MRFKFTLRRKILLTFGPLIVLLFLMGAIAANQARLVNSLLVENYKDGTVNIKLMGDAVSQALRVRERLILITSLTTPAEQIRQFEKMNQEAEKLDDLIGQYKAREASEGNPEEGVAVLLNEFDAAWSKARQTSDEVARAAMAGRTEEAQLELIGSAENQNNYAVDLLLLIQDVEDNRSLERFNASQQIDRRVGSVLTALVVAANLIAVVVGFWFSRAIATRIDEVAASANHIAAGNLSGRVEVRSNDEIGDLAAAFNKMANRLQEVLGGLEQRVAARTRDLSLAAEVGGRISTVRDLDTLLAESVELIRSEFDLYYVQIYLAGANGRHLKLAAGTGEAGEALLRQGHQLAIGPGSINGSAGARREAVVVPDTATSPIFRPNPLLPETRSEMAVPMVVGDRLEGVLNLQDNRPNSLTGDNLAAFEAVATQLAIALENARLFVEATQAQETMAAQARVLARGGWDSFLDAVHRREWFGYVYDADKVQPLAETISPQVEADGVTAPIAVSGEPIGVIQMEADEARPLTFEDTELIEAVARQVAERIENLRLLVEAERFREEAEAAARRLVREGWETYQETSDGMAPGYVFDHNQVQPVSEDAFEVSFKQELTIQGEKIGELGLADIDEIDEETRDLVQTVADQLSAHLENLRLSQQTEAALASTARLYDSGRRLNTSGDDLQEALAAVVEANPIPQVDRVIMFLFEQDDKGEMQGIRAVANWQNNHPAMPPTAVGTYYSRDAMAALGLLLSPEPISFADIQNDARVDPVTVGILKQLKIRAMAVIPLWVDDRQLGCLLVETAVVHAFQPSDIESYAAMAGQLAVAVDRNLLLSETQARARREQILRQVSDRVHAARDAESILRTAAQEVSRALGVEAFVYLDDQIGNGHSRQVEENGKKV